MSKPISTIDALGWGRHFADQVSDVDLTATPPVRVTEVHRSGLQVQGDGIDQVLPPREDATVGDWLLLDKDFPADSRLLDRTSVVKRRAAGTEWQMQLIAANIDTAFIVTSCNPDFNVARLERYIALALQADVTPVIILTKTDLCDDVDAYLKPAQAISDLVEVVALDARSDQPADKLAKWCGQGQTVAFLGSSGVGKSTLSNALMGSDTMVTQDMRVNDAKGRHTTTHRQMLIAPMGCVVLDTPGMRELQLTDAAEGVGELFSDLQDLTHQCKFRDCKHDSEPGCAVKKAVADGTIEPDRLARWQKLVTEDAFNSANLAERRAKDKDFGKMVRSAIKHKRR